MTIKELIAKLQRYDPETEVKVMTAVGDRNVTREIWNVGPDDCQEDKPVIYIHG